MAPIEVSSEPTIQCTFDDADSQHTPSFGLLPPPSSQKTAVSGQTMGLLTASRLSSKSTLVTTSSRSGGVAGNALVGSIYRSTPTDNNANAVDSTLSLNIRPTGWTHSMFGRSVRMLGAGTGGCVDLHFNHSTKKRQHLQGAHVRLLVKNIPRLHSADTNFVFFGIVIMSNEQPQRPSSMSPHQQKSNAVTGILGRRVLEELGIAATVRHQNIVHTHEIIVEPDHGKCYVVMDACKIDLLTLLQFQVAGKIPTIPDRVLDWYFVQLVRGVQYLHNMGIGHRDLKLDNVCITEQGVLKIVDFGCATLFRRRRIQKPQAAVVASQVSRRPRGGRSRTVPYIVPRQQQQEDCEYVETMSFGTCGSDPYMAPELFLGGYYSAAKVDIWAVGIIYFAMQHQQFPWAIAQPSKDSRYNAFSRNNTAFIDTWFSDTINLTPTPPPAKVPLSLSASTFNFNMTRLGARTTTATMPTAKQAMSRVFDINPTSRSDIHGIICDPWFQSLSRSIS
ncbi:kinase-like protein [Coemansia reversa NRRL 1564]|uniref:non-specific serine/threonine protein kinase n=1 Tax=Coemansia reversa (strain ATCC 12441 / NRRL 1564) TaxID=763665 RepID=A0A2G5BHV0_COERN|nr:kinase-like protein [Coemansia reversa NRRL 1564]|eukprot:PIA18596.1 kinase-like protein [Coemansia reversa NRRL 1564]